MRFNMIRWYDMWYVLIAPDFGVGGFIYESIPTPKAAKFISKEMNIWFTEHRFDYLAKLHDWRRKIDPNHGIAIAVKRGAVNKEDYPRIIFPGNEDYDEI